MAGERAERRLAAILAADVVGYSRLMGRDEEGTLTAIKGLRHSLFDPKVSEHRGRIFKTTGDGALVEFASAVDAMRCAIEVQRAMAERNMKLPDEWRVRKAGKRVRIGAQVVEAETGIHVWAERYDRPLDDIFALEDEITLSVVGAIEPSLRAAEIE